MRILYFETTVPGSIPGWHQDQHIKGVYVPSKDVILAEVTQGMRSLYGLLRNEETFALARGLASLPHSTSDPQFPMETTTSSEGSQDGSSPSGIPPPPGPLTASNVNWLEHPDQAMEDLITNAQQLSHLDSLVMAGVQEILKGAGR